MQVARTPLQAFKKIPQDNWTPAIGRERELSRRKMFANAKAEIIEPHPGAVRDATMLKISSDGVMTHWLEHIEQECGNIAAPKQYYKCPIKVYRVINIVSRSSQFPVFDLIGPSRLQKLCKTRQIGMYLAHKHSGRSFVFVGKKFNRDHSTVMHGCRKVEGLIERGDSYTCWLIKKVESEL